MPNGAGVVRCSNFGEGTNETDGWTVVHYFAAMNTVLSAEALKRCSSSPQLPSDAINATDSRDRAPLHICCIYDHVEMLRWLLGNGALVELRDATDGSPLQVALRHHSWECVCELIQWADRKHLQLPQGELRSLSQYRWSPSANQCDTNILLRKQSCGTKGGPLLWDALHRNGEWSLLHLSVMFDVLHPLAVFLCHHCPHLVAVVETVSGFAPMHCAALLNSKEEILQALCRADLEGSASLQREASRGRFPVHCLASSGAHSCMVSWLTKALHANGLETSADDVLDNDGLTLMHYACAAWCDEIERESSKFDKKPELVNELANSSASLAMIKLLSRQWGMSVHSTGRTSLSPRDIVGRSPYGSILLCILDALDEFYESHDF